METKSESLEEKIKPLEVITELGREVSGAIAKSIAVTIDYAISPLLIPTNIRKALIDKSDYTNGKLAVGRLVGVLSFTSAMGAMGGGHEEIGIPFLVLLGANALSGVFYEGIRYAYRKTETKLKGSKK